MMKESSTVDPPGENLVKARSNEIRCENSQILE